MDNAAHAGLAIQKLAIGREMAPLLIIDNVVADADALVEVAASKHFSDVISYYPGVRSKAPLSYQQFILRQFGGLFSEFFGLQKGTVRFTSCHFSLVTTPHDKLDPTQRIPHTDSQLPTELAFVHYLFKGDLGGTAFYRHRKTGFEVVDQARRPGYLACVDEEHRGPDRAANQYINGSTALYEQIAAPQGVFNRMLAYRRNSLHCGNIPDHFVPDSNPRTGRLSLNGFLAGSAAA